MVKSDSAILKITRRQNLGIQEKNLNRCMTHAVTKYVWLLLVLVLLLLLLLLLLLEGEAVLIIAQKLLQSPTAAWKNPIRWNYWKCNCASRNNSVDVANY